LENGQRILRRPDFTDEIVRHQLPGISIRPEVGVVLPLLLDALTAGGSAGV